MNKQYLLLLFIVFLSCKEKGKFKSPPGYDLKKPKTFMMPDALNEISGIAFYRGNNDTLYAEQDESGKLFYLHPGDKKAAGVKFASKGDFEDMTIMNETVIMLRSDGTLFSFPFSERHADEIADAKEWDKLLPAGEYEGLCSDASKNQLYVLCKHCADDETTKAISAYILQLQPDGTLSQSGSASVSVTTIEKLVNESKFKFHPSALGKNNKTGQWFIVSSVNKMLVIADQDWNVQNVYHLDPTVFRQPEGITFDKENNLYISNEGDEISTANVLKFEYKP